MRAIGMLSLAGLILSGLSPAPIAPAIGAAQRSDRVVTREDPDARCAPFFAGFGDNEDRAYGRGAALRSRRGISMGGVVSPPLPPPPPPPPPPPQSPQPMVAQDQAARGQIAVTGTRVAPGYVAQ